MTACFGGIRRVWAKLVLLLWEVVLSSKQGELGTAAVWVTVVVGKWLYETDLPPVGCREYLGPGWCVNVCVVVVGAVTMASQEWVLDE